MCISSVLSAHNLWKLFEVSSLLSLSTVMTTTIAELRALTTSTVLTSSFFLKVIVWMCLFTAAGIPRDPTSSAIQKRIAAQVAASSPIHKVQKEKQCLYQPSLALSLPVEIFAFDYFHQKKLPVAMLPRIENKDVLHKKESTASFGGGNLEENHNATAVTRSDLAMMEMDQEEFVLASFAVPYDYFSSPLRLHTLEETEIKSKEDKSRRLMPSSSWIDYVAGCESHCNCGISFVRGRGNLFLAAGELIAVLSALFSVIIARISSNSRCRKEKSHIIVTKKRTMVMPPLNITCRTHPNCRCLCRTKTSKFLIPHAPKGYKRVLVPTPGAKCGAREFIVAHEVQQHLATPFKPLPPPNAKICPTLDPIPEVPIGYTRVLVPLPGTKCGERDYIVVQENGKLLHEDDDVSSTKNPPPASRKKISRRIGIREKVLPFELHDQIIQYSYDHMNWTTSLMREYHPEFFLYGRTISRKSNFFRSTVGHCASRLGCYIGPIVEEDCILDSLASSDESNHPSVGQHVVKEGCHYDDSSSSFLEFVQEDDVLQEDVVCAAAAVVATTTCTIPSTISSSRLTSAPSSAPTEDPAYVFADSSCNDDLGMDVNNEVTLQQQGSGYYIDDKGRKRRYSLRILAKKAAPRIKNG